jgi:hypothetical protein
MKNKGRWLPASAWLDDWDSGPNFEDDLAETRPEPDPPDRFDDSIAMPSALDPVQSSPVQSQTRRPEESQWGSAAEGSGPSPGTNGV